MSAKARVRESCNANQSSPKTINEKILIECHKIYTDPDKGLIKIAEHFGIKLLPPRKKIIVLLIGNHSAGKSSFINWYIEEHVQKTGVAIETQGFILVTSGKRRESLTGNATLHLFPHFKPLENIPGVVDFLSTEISSSKQKNFSLVTFVDTPGLVDGDMHYPYDVNEGMLWLGGMADLICVFFDPIGQALCRRTLTLVEQLNIVHPEKLRFYLSKADDAGDDADRQKVMMQIVQELCKRTALNRTGFDMPTIFIPDVSKPSKCINQIDSISKEIDKLIHLNIQSTLNSIETTCKTLEGAIEKCLTEDQEHRSHNFRTYSKAMFIAGVGGILPFLILLSIASSIIGDNNFEKIFGKLALVLVPVNEIWSAVPQEKQLYILIGILVFSYLLFNITRLTLGLKTTLSRKQKKQFTEMLHYIRTSVRSRKENLYSEYLEQSIGAQDL